MQSLQTVSTYLSKRRYPPLLTIQFGREMTDKVGSMNIMLQHGACMYNNVWQQGNGSNTPIRKIICRTTYIEKK